MKTAANSPADQIIRRTLLTSETVIGEFRERLAREMARGRLSLRAEAELLEDARRMLAEYEPLLAELISNSDLYGWIAGYDATAKKTPQWLLDLLRRPGKPPGPPPRITLPGLLGDDDDEPPLRFPILDKAFQSLLERDILTRDQYDLLGAEAKQRAFTIAGDLAEETIVEIRDVLAEDIEEGTSLRGFTARVEDRLNASPVGPAHLETVYRTNVQAAFRDGRESLANNPIIRDVFPYQEYLPIGDGRVREEHEALGQLGLDGTGVYRRDDPFWDNFTPPWGFNCRCGTNLLTIEAAARKGVKEAQRWLETGQLPAYPEHRLQHIPFPPEPGFGSRGRATVGR
jgi:SPP1 gp7 family putative phage head morphogenesis protein